MATVHLRHDDAAAAFRDAYPHAADDKHLASYARDIARDAG